MDTYSRIVAFFKVLLPLAALAILATLFLLSRSVDPTATIPFAQADMEDRMRDQQVTAPFFSGTTPKGEEIIVTAAIARPGGFGAPAEATNVSARLTLADGARITLDADTVRVTPNDDMASFSGDVRIATSTGYVLRTELLNTALSGIRGNAPGTVTGTGPIGDFTAGQMDITSQKAKDSVHLLFKSGVKLIYDPKQSER